MSLRIVVDPLGLGVSSNINHGGSATQRTRGFLLRIKNVAASDRRRKRRLRSTPPYALPPLFLIFTLRCPLTQIGELGGQQHKAEAYVAVAVVGVVAAIRDTATTRVGVPTTAPKHAERTR